MQRVEVICNQVRNQLQIIIPGLILMLALVFSAQPAAAAGADAINAADDGIGILPVAFFVLTVVSMVAWQLRPQFD